LFSQPPPCLTGRQARPLLTVRREKLLMYMYYILSFLFKEGIMGWLTAFKL